MVQEREDPQPQTKPTVSPLEPSEISDADLVIRSSDLVNFRVNRLVLAVASPFSMLYPLRPVIPKSYDKVSFSLATL